MDAEKFVDKTKLKSEYECQLPYTKTHLNRETSHVQYGIDKDKVKYCCDEFEHELGLSLYFDLDHDYNTQKTIPQIAFDRVDGHDFEHDTIEHIERIPIQFCPFCGGQINLYLSKELERYVTECKEKIVKEPVYGVRECSK